MITGLGSIGRRHLRNLLALGEQDILLYRTFRSTLSDDELADFPVEIELEAALAHHPGAVIVANPTALHLDVAIPAAQAGCHLFLEKPISHSLERIDELQAAVEHGGGQVFVGYQFRFHPGLQQVHRLLQEGAIGRPLSVRAHWGEYLPNWHPWEDYRQGYSARQELGGGVILTLSHPLDYLRWLLGDVVDLWAFSAQSSDLELHVEDTAEIGLRFASGVLGSLHLDYNQRPPAHWLEIVATQGTLRWNNADGSAQIYRATGPTGEEMQRSLPAPRNEGPAFTAEPAWERIPAPQGFERNHLFLAQMQHFLEITQGKASPLCTLRDGIQALHLALAAHASQSSGEIIHL